MYFDWPKKKYTFLTDNKLLMEINPMPRCLRESLCGVERGHQFKMLPQGSNFFAV